MQILAIAVAALIAVAGWIVTQWQARRAMRRTMRVEYLLDAYRRLEAASNREMIEADERQVESAIADICLLGSSSQVDLAEAFACEFAEGRRATTLPLLQELRASLRDELLLDPVKPLTVFLRVGRGKPTTSTDSFIESVYSDIAGSIKRTLGVELHRPESPITEPSSGTTSPEALMLDDLAKVESELRALVRRHDTSDVSTLNVAQLASRALELGLIEKDLADAANGLSVMHMLAALDPSRPDTRRVQEFSAFATAILYVLERIRTAEGK